LKPKEKAKYLAEIAAQCKRLGKFTQSFAVGIAPVFDDKVVLRELVKMCLFKESDADVDI